MEVFFCVRGRKSGHLFLIHLVEAEDEGKHTGEDHQTGEDRQRDPAAQLCLPERQAVLLD